MMEDFTTSGEVDYEVLNLVQDGVISDGRLSENFYGPVAVAFLTFGLVSMFGNVLLLFTFCRVKDLRKTAVNIYTIHLAANNAFLGSMAFRIGVDVLRRRSSVGSGISCQVEGFILSTIHMNVMLTIAIMCIERYVVICKSKVSSTSLSFCHYRPALVIILIWIHSLFWAFWPLSPLVPDYEVITIIPCCMFSRRFTAANLTYILGMALSVFILPLIVVAATMGRVYKVVRRTSKIFHGKNRRRFILRTPKASENDSVSGRQSASNARISEISVQSNAGSGMQSRAGSEADGRLTRRGLRKLKEDGYLPERAVLRALAVLVTSFSISWTPYLLVCLVELGGIPVDPYLEAISLLISKLSCIHSSYAYASHRHYRAVIKYLKCHEKAPKTRKGTCTRSCEPSIISGSIASGAKSPSTNHMCLHLQNLQK